ncbi:hypothetical protein DAEQUDRAFT_432076 [Daedalea quercina L-15889]|uniref:Uncharacterized protein n=1 Tax=Daedalea quercina L-15889 TaxID=1314783 RepID=A0A165NGC4_9APHY|nr:hypothetical protein DAEQUDRAFT_432076 [Daedalea quercina L-15889]
MRSSQIVSTMNASHLSHCIIHLAKLFEAYGGSVRRRATARNAPSALEALLLDWEGTVDGALSWRVYRSFRQLSNDSPSHTHSTHSHIRPLWIPGACRGSQRCRTNRPEVFVSNNTVSRRGTSNGTLVSSGPKSSQCINNRHYRASVHVQLFGLQSLHPVTHESIS